MAYYNPVCILIALFIASAICQAGKIADDAMEEHYKKLEKGE